VKANPAKRSIEGKLTLASLFFQNCVAGVPIKRANGMSATGAKMITPRIVTRR
jgi:hypothetical protein